MKKHHVFLSVIVFILFIQLMDYGLSKVSDTAINRYYIKQAIPTLVHEKREFCELILSGKSTSVDIERVNHVVLVAKIIYLLITSLKWGMYFMVAFFVSIKIKLVWRL